MYYKFRAINWKSDVGKAFTFYKRFPSVYLADRYSTRLSLQNKRSPYTVVLLVGEELENME